MTNHNERDPSGAGEGSEPLTDAQVRAAAWPGESWEQARRRLQGERRLQAEASDVYGDDSDDLADDLEALTHPALAAGDVLFDDWSGLTIGQVAALAAPGETWEAGRDRAYRLHHCVTSCAPCPVCNHDGIQPYGGWMDRPGSGCGVCALRENTWPSNPTIYD